MTAVAPSPTPPAAAISTDSNVSAGAASRRGSINLFTRLKAANRSSQHFENYSHMAQQPSDDSTATGARTLASSTDRAYPIVSSGKGFQGGQSAAAKKRSRRLWSRKVSVRVSASQGPTRHSISHTCVFSPTQTHDAPPVPDLPPSLNITLPFEPSSNTLTTSSSFSSDGKTGGGYVIVPAASADAAPRPAAPLPLASTATNTPTPAAAVVHQYAAKEQALKDSGVSRAQALADARLTLAQVTEVVQLAGSEIKQRGLANVGILRPFRVGTTPATAQRLAELYLLTADPEKYSNTLSISEGAAATSDIAIATFGKPSARKELTKQLAYANVHSVADLLKWALRRLKVSPSADFNSTAESPLRWYNTFRDAERQGGYDKKAYSAILLPLLPPATRALFGELLDLLTTVSAHYVANAMPASRAAKSLGYWLFGRIGTDRPAQDLDTFLQDWQRSSAIMEHLLLAYLRDQSTKLHYMPTRLAELIEGYPFIPVDSPLQAPAIRTASKFVGSSSTTGPTQSALRVHLRGDNIDASAGKPRGPQDTLASALDAKLPDAESSAEADDWTSLVTLARAAAKKAQLAADGAVASPKLIDEVSVDASGVQVPFAAASSVDDERVQLVKQDALMRDEDARLFAVFAAEFAERKKLLGVKDEVTGKHSSSDGESRSVASTLPRSSSIYKDFMSRSGATGSSTLAPLRTKRLSTLAEDAASIPGRASSSTAGNGNPIGNGHADPNGSSATTASSRLAELGSLGFDTGKGDFDLTLDAIALPATDATTRAARTSVDAQSTTAEGPRASSMASKIRRQSSLGALRQRVRSSKRWDDSGANVPALPTLAAARPSFSVTKVTSLATFDESVVALWQDSVLDFNPAIALPRVVFVQLNQEASAKLMSSASGVAGSGESQELPTSPTHSVRLGGLSVASSSTHGGSGSGSGGSWLIIEEELVGPTDTLRSGGGPTRGGTTRLRGSTHDPLLDSMDDGASMDGRRSLFSPSLRSLGASIRRRASLKRMASFGGGLRKRTTSSRALDGEAGMDTAKVDESAVPAVPAVPAVHSPPKTLHAAVLPPVKTETRAGVPPKSPARGAYKALEEVKEPEQDIAPPRMSSAASSRYVDAEGGEE